MGGAEGELWVRLSRSEEDRLLTGNFSVEGGCMRIGFVGLGIMGRPMALNLLRAGHAVTVWARRPESVAPL